jgi:hypothetical protein
MPVPDYVKGKKYSDKSTANKDNCHLEAEKHGCYNAPSLIM